MNAAWVFCRLGLDPEWKTKVRAEVDSAVSKHRIRAEQTPLEVLKTLTVDDWES